MHKLIIKNFGPLADIEMDIGGLSDKFIFVLGEQASGKSTLAKLIYFFRTLQDEFITLLFSNNAYDSWDDFYVSYRFRLKGKFVGIFGETQALGNYEGVYYFASEKSVTIKSDKPGSFSGIMLSGGLCNELKKVWYALQDNAGKLGEREDIPLVDKFITGAKDKEILNGLVSVFEDDSYITYVPAGRAIISQQLFLNLIQAEDARQMVVGGSSVSNNIIDAPTKNYLSEVARVRGCYLSPLYENKLYGKSGGSYVKYLRALSEGVLKGSYSADKQNDFLTVAENKRVKMSNASSGQQEVLWLLNLLNFYAAEKRKCFLIIEEPEAHLHPEAQYMLAKIIAAFCNYTGSQIFITTHSPYILSSFNNLIYAGKCGGQAADHDKLSGILPKESWISPEAFSAYMLEEGRIRSINDKELAMIDTEELDSVASRQDTEYEKMRALRLEVR